MCNLEFCIKQFATKLDVPDQIINAEINLKEAERIQGILWRGKATFVRKQKFSKKEMKLLSVLTSFLLNSIQKKKNPKRLKFQPQCKQGFDFILKIPPFGGA